MASKNNVPSRKQHFDLPSKILGSANRCQICKPQQKNKPHKKFHMLEAQSTKTYPTGIAFTHENAVCC